jgi:hypothetical protein
LPHRKPALLWGDFDKRTQEHGFATTGGAISTTGIAGLTLGGGIGWLMGKHGLTCDNLTAAHLVDAEGRMPRASVEENPDLFWALRGGGGNFGVVTDFEYRIHPLEKVMGGILLYPRPQGAAVLRHYRDLTVNAADELTAYAALMHGPDGGPLTAVALCHSGDDPVAAERDVGRFSATTAPIVNLTGWKRYQEIGTMLDMTAPKGLHYYFKCTFLPELADGAIETILRYGETAPTPQTTIILEHIHGRVCRVAEDATAAFALRRTQYSLNIATACSGDPGAWERCVEWARAFAGEMTRFGTGSTYIIYLGEEGTAPVLQSYGSNYRRLSEIKAKFDPDNFFRFNQNIEPGIR